MNVRFQPVRMAAEGGGEGRLTYVEDQLVAVLVRLSAMHGEAAGRWFLEAAFGELDGPAHPIFCDLEEAEAWIEAALIARSRTRA